MAAPSPSNRVPRAADAGLIALFLILLWLPTCDWLWGLDHTPVPNENRKLAEFPKYFGRAATGSFLTAFDQFFQDHFGFRQQLVHWNAQWKRKLFNESPFDMALQGREGWLYWAREGMLENYTGQAQFSQTDLQNWRQLLEARRDWLAQRGEKYIFVVAPNKESIYPEFLPEWVLKSGRPGKLDQFLAYMRAHSSVPVLDLRPSLIAAKKEAPTYLRTDTHWNSFGAFIAYQQILCALQPDMPGLQPLPMEAFTRIPTVGHEGDLAFCIQQQDELQETMGITFKPLPPLSPLQLTGETNSPVGTVVSRNPDQRGKAVVFRDSFAEALTPFIGYHFNEVLYLWQMQWNKELLEKEHPDLVVDEIVERHFNNANPRQLLLGDDQRPRVKQTSLTAATTRESATFP